MRKKKSRGRTNAEDRAKLRLEKELEARRVAFTNKLLFRLSVESRKVRRAEGREDV